MLKDFKRIARQGENVTADALGAVALMVSLVACLHLPGLY